jgi:hypothetical protein
MTALFRPFECCNFCGKPTKIDFSALIQSLNFLMVKKKFIPCQVFQVKVLKTQPRFGYCVQVIKVRNRHFPSANHGA